jgi:hypothetical protein
VAESNNPLERGEQTNMFEMVVIAHTEAAACGPTAASFTDLRTATGVRVAIEPVDCFLASVPATFLFAKPSQAVS